MKMMRSGSTKLDQAFGPIGAAIVLDDLPGAARSVAETFLRRQGRIPDPVALIVWPGPKVDGLLMMVPEEEDPTLTVAAEALGDEMRRRGALGYAVVIEMEFHFEIRDRDGGMSRDGPNGEGVGIFGQDKYRRPFCALYSIERTPEGDFGGFGVNRMSSLEPVSRWCSLLDPIARH